MKRIFRFNMMAIMIALFFVTCKSKEKKEEPSTVNTDTSAKTTPMTTGTTENMDAAKVAPDRYQVVKDTMGIRMLNVVYKPGDSSAMHSHPDNVLYVIDGGKTQFTMQDGSKQTMEFKGGTIMILPGGTHSVKNVGTTTTRSILVEVNRPNKAGVMQDASMDATKVASALYKVVADTMNIRVLMATYKPGASSAMHAHPDNAIYVIEGGNAEFTMKDGTKQTMNMEKGMSSITPAGMHSVKNTGKTTTKVLIVEVNRPQQ